MLDDLLRASGFGFLVLVGIGVLCLAKHLWDEIGRWCGMSWRGLLLGGWEPGGLTWGTFKIDWQWKEKERDEN